MPRPPSDLVPIGVRIPEAVRDAADDRAKAEGLIDARNGRPNRSEFTRIAFVYALQHMPLGWRPDTASRSYQYGNGAGPA